MPDDPTQPDLSLVDTDDLLDEVKARTTALVCAYELPDKTDDYCYHTFVHFKGSPNTCVGLAVRARREIQNDIALGGLPPEE